MPLSLLPHSRNKTGMLVKQGLAAARCLYRKLLFIQDPGMNDYHGAHGGQAPLLAFLRGESVSKVSFLKSVVGCLVVYFILSWLLYQAFSANLGLLCMPHPGIGPLV